MVYCKCFFVSLGTSGSRTPDDDLDTSNFAQRRISSPRTSNENLTEDDKVSATRDSLYSVLSRSSSSYSVAPSFTSDFVDTDALLPDHSDSVGSGKVNHSESFELPEKDTRITDLQSVSRTQSYSGDSSARPRPRTLVLLKRNSDLPGRVQRTDDFNTGYFPVGMKSSNSDTNLNKDPFAIEEEVSVASLSEAMHSSVDTLENSLTDDLVSVDELSGYDVRKQTSSINEPADVTHVADSDTSLSPVEGGVSEELVPNKIVISPAQSPTKEKSKYDLPSPSKVQPPPVSKKPARSPSVEKNNFVPAEKSAAEEIKSVPKSPAEDGSRELIVPVMTALQERRSSTPDCSTAQASTDTKKVSDRVVSPSESPSDERKYGGFDEKKPDVKALTRSACTTRVSVKDRLQQYERNRSGSPDSGRKHSSEPFNPNSVASRKQLFEQRERGLYKRVSDTNTRKPRSDSGSGSSSASGSPKLSRKRLIDSGDVRNAMAAGSPVQSTPEKAKPVEQEKQYEPARRRRSDRSEKTERRRSLVLDNLDKMDSHKLSRPRSGDYESLKLDLHDAEKETLSPREIDIPLDDGFTDRHRSERPRRSPNTSPRDSRGNVRSPFPDDSREEDREPQFV